MVLICPRQAFCMTLTAAPAHPRTIGVDALNQMRDLPPIVDKLERLAYVVYTSGTSGVPRAVGHAHRAIWARQMMVDGWYALTPEDRLCHAGAFNWTYTLGTGLMDPWTIGATALIPKPGTDIATLPDLLRAHRATIFAAAPGVYRKLLQDHVTLNLPDLRHGLCAGEKPSVALHEASRPPAARSCSRPTSECSTFFPQPHPSRCRGRLGQPQDGGAWRLLARTVRCRVGRKVPLPYTAATRAWCWAI